MKLDIIILLISIAPHSSTPRSHHICQSESDCEGDFMTCRENHCVCDEDEEREALDVLISSGEVSPVAPPSGNCRGIALVGDYCDNVTQICTSHSACNSLQVCECLETFEVYNYPKECMRSYSFPCDNEQLLLCNPEKFFECEEISMKCGCTHGMKYDEVLDRCVSAVGQQCEIEAVMHIQKGCGQGAECEKGQGGYYGICKCLPDYYPEEGEKEEEAYKCIPVMGKSCNSSEHCLTSNNEYVCKESQCNCKEGLVYEEIGCRLKIGSECENNNAKMCAKNAICNQKCLCKEGFVPTKNGQCELSYGSNCSNFTTNCHQDSGLFCINDSCTCKDLHTYSHSKKHCLGVHLQQCDPINPHCVPHSSCDPTDKVCICDETFSVKEDGTCFFGFGTICDIKKNDQCLLEFEMECSQNYSNYSCQCIPNQGKIYDKISAQCLLKVGENCSYTGENRRCIKSAFCGTNDKCQCYNGYSPTPEGDCLKELNFGENCGSNTLSCNSYKGLECLRNKCNCAKGKVYSQDEQVCVDLGSSEDEEMVTPVGSPYHMAMSSTNLPALSKNDNNLPSNVSSFVASKVVIGAFITSLMLLLIL